jgi:hypothetical protein
MPNKKDLEKYLINKTLGEYKHLNFVDRVLNKDKYPILDYGDGNYATHKMSYSTNDKGAIVYPNIIYSPKENKLRELPPDEAYRYAMETGEYIPFDSDSDADWFSQNYKKVWE